MLRPAKKFKLSRKRRRYNRKKRDLGINQRELKSRGES